MYKVIEKLQIVSIRKAVSASFVNVLCKQCFSTVLKRLASNAETLIENGIKNRKVRGDLFLLLYIIFTLNLDMIICRHFSCLLDWIVDGKLDVMKTDNSLCGSILNVAELAQACVFILFFFSSVFLV